MTTLRPLEHLNAVMHRYPSTGPMVDEFRRDRGKKFPDWPEWCFVPMAGWHDIVSNDNKDECDSDGSLPLHLILDLGRLAAIGTWRYSQGIYRFDADFLAALKDTLITGDIPSEVLYRLPEWSIYIETPGLEWLGEMLYGFWAHLEYDLYTHRHELRLLLDTEELLIPMPVHIGPWTVTEAIDRMISESQRQLKAHNIDIDEDLICSMDDVQDMAASTNPLISLLLYICSEAPEIDNDREPGTSPKRPQPTKTKHGWRLFPAEKPHIWTVGKEIGTKLRQADSVASDTGRTVKPHIRRGHWHGFWTGPREGKRKFVYHWLMPAFVGGSSGD